MDIGTKIKLMGSALTLIQMVDNTKDSILMENWKVKESILGPMVAHTLDIINQTNTTVLVHMYGPTELNTKVNGKRTNSMASVSLPTINHCHCLDNGRMAKEQNGSMASH